MPNATKRPTVSASWVITVADALAPLGFDAHGWLAAHGAPPSVLGRPKARVPWALPIAMWDAARAETGDAHLGLHAAETLPTALRDSLAFMAMSSATLGELFDHYHRYQELVSTTRSMAIERAPAEVGLVLRSGATPPLTHQQIDFHLALWVRVCRFVAGERFAALRVELVRAAPSGGSAEYRRAFGCPVRFGQTRDALVVSHEMMRCPSAFANPLVLRTLTADADRRLLELEGAAWVARVRAVLVAKLPAAGGGLADVARHFGIAARTLQRHLTREGVGFAELVDDTRRDVAVGLVVAGGLSHAQISHRLGFADVRCFRRAFVRWTSLTPQAYREQATRRAAAAS